MFHGIAEGSLVELWFFPIKYVMNDLIHINICINCGVLRRRWFSIIIHRGHLAWCFSCFILACVCFYVRSTFHYRTVLILPEGFWRLYGFLSLCWLFLFIVREYCITSNTYHHSPLIRFCTEIWRIVSMQSNFSRLPYIVLLHSLYRQYRQCARYRLLPLGLHVGIHANALLLVSRNGWHSGFWLSTTYLQRRIFPIRGHQIFVIHVNTLCFNSCLYLLNRSARITWHIPVSISSR